jgi:hypothetical protein
MSLPSELAGEPVKAHTPPHGIQAYRNLHLWMVVGLAITLLGFAPSYFMNLRASTWYQHLHGLSATFWMCLLVLQPYLATHGRLKQHRRFGIVALILAGMVATSALAVVPFNIQNAVEGTHGAAASKTFFYGISYFDLISVAGFLIAVLMATLSVHKLGDHVIWMSSTVFWVLSPGLTRLIAFSMLYTVGLGDVTLLDIVFWTSFPIVALAVFLMIRLRRAHPALVLAAIGNAGIWVITPVGDSATWRAICDAVFLLN